VDFLKIAIKITLHLLNQRTDHLYEEMMDGRPERQKLTGV